MNSVHCIPIVGAPVAMKETRSRFEFRFFGPGEDPARSRPVTLLEPSASLLVEEPWLTFERRTRDIERTRATRLRRVDLDSDRDVFRGLVVDTKKLEGSSGCWIPHAVAVAALGRLVARPGRSLPSIYIMWSHAHRSTLVASRRGVLDIRGTLAAQRMLTAGQTPPTRPRLWLGDCSEGFPDLVDLPVSFELESPSLSTLDARDQLTVGACLAARLPGVVRPSPASSNTVSTRAGSSGGVPTSRAPVRMRAPGIVRSVTVAAVLASVAVVATGLTKAELERTRLTDHRDGLRAEIERSQLNHRPGRTQR